MRFLVIAKARNHNGERRFFVNASSQKQASDMARREAPQAGEITIRLIKR